MPPFADMANGITNMEARQLPLVSVVIPTFNRRESLLYTLESLEQQSYPLDRLEVVVVDDGGDDGTEAIAQRGFPFALRYLRQKNQGAAVARNHGARESIGEFLVFVDDDIRLLPETVERLAVNAGNGRVILLGTLTTPDEASAGSVFARLANPDRSMQSVTSEAGEVPFQHCMTGLLGVRRDDFLDLGMFRDPTGGWPNWDDVDFGYRAHQAGYRLLRVRGAVAEHWDYALSDLRSACRRWERGAFSGATLLQRYPELSQHIPMFADKGPIEWQQEPPRVILRKLARQAASSPPVMWAMECAVPTLERLAPDSTALRLLYRWIVSGYIYRGYREGLRAMVR
jgi:glycosyltransferase involved in cell wall biosynthesis